MQKSIYQFFFFVHSLSIDIALGAVAFMFAIHQLFFPPTAAIPYYEAILLFLSTLSVYWIDHLQDSHNVLLVQPGARHTFFLKNAWLMKTLLLFIFITCAYISLTYLPLFQVIGGVLLCALMGLYLFKHRHFKRKIILEKETLIAALYTVSVFYFPCVNTLNTHSLKVLVRPDQLLFLAMVLLPVFLSTLQNLFSIARIEAEKDAEAGVRSIAALFGSDRLAYVQKLMLLLQGVNSVILLFLVHTPHLASFLGVLLSIAMLNFLLPILFPNPQNAWYRIVGDACFILAFLV